MAKAHIKETQVYFGITPNTNEERNTQSIKEALMREAVKQCDGYCTDLLIFFDYTWKDLIRGDIQEVSLYFRKMGIDWKKECDGYRSKAVLKRDIENDSLELAIEYGIY